MSTLSCGICRCPIVNSDLIQLSASLERKIFKQRYNQQQQVSNQGNSSSGDSSNSPQRYFKKNEAVASAGCGHLFHKRCLALRQVGSSMNGTACPTCQNELLGERSKQDSMDFGSLDEFSRDGTISTLTRRSYLRKKIIELKELEGGIRKGCKVVCYPDQPEEGQIKWIGKINQIIYIGVEFDNPIGNNFPETNGAPPFPCNVPHARLVLRNDLVLSSEYFRGEPKKKKVLENNINNFPDNCSGGSSSCSETSTTTFELIEIDFPDSGTSSLNLMNSNNNDPLVEEFSMKLNNFYELCVEINSFMESTKNKLDGLNVGLLPPNPNSISISLGKAKGHLSEVEQRYSQLEMSKKESEELFNYPDILLPSEERRIQRTLAELENTQDSLEERLSGRMQTLEMALDACQTVQELIKEKMDWLNGMRSQLRQMERNLIKTESELTVRINRIQGFLHSLSLSEEEEMIEINNKILDFKRLGGDECKLQSNAKAILQFKSQLGIEIQWKFETLTNVQLIFKEFSKEVRKFEEWYEIYMAKIRMSNLNRKLNNNGIGIGSNNNLQKFQLSPQTHPDLIKEREEIKIQFYAILSTARQLRVSVFDPCLLEDKIESLQTQWRTLIGTVYHPSNNK